MSDQISPPTNQQQSTAPTATTALPSHLTLYPESTYIHLTLLSSSSSSSSSSSDPSYLQRKSPSEPLDNLSAYTYITSALTRYLGLHGSAINFDILKCGNESLTTSHIPLHVALSSPSYPEAKQEDEAPASTQTQSVNQKNGDEEERDQDVWIRIHREDSQAVIAALSSWSKVEDVNDAGKGGDGGIAWRIKGWGESLGALVAGETEERIWNV